MSIRRGKLGEYRIIVELLKRGYNVFEVVDDNEGIDFVIRLPNGRYIEIQAKYKKDGYFNQFYMRKEPSDNYFFIFYWADEDHFWIVPSKEIKEKASYQQDGVWKNTYTINLTSGVQRETFKDYKDKWDLLEREVEKQVKE
ncbi:hypothetical protein HYX02_02170 [Candidatus Woesearchaeota archaeon]|nr:hypothetical protein [Candidatus Woesearchaeota archaeon]